MDQKETPQSSVGLAVSSRRGLSIFYDQIDFSDDETNDLIEELEDALDLIQQNTEKRTPDNGYCSE